MCKSTNMTLTFDIKNISKSNINCLPCSRLLYKTPGALFAKCIVGEFSKMFYRNFGNDKASQTVFWYIKVYNVWLLELCSYYYELKSTFHPYFSQCITTNLFMAHWGSVSCKKCSYFLHNKCEQNLPDFILGDCSQIKYILNTYFG